LYRAATVHFRLANAYQEQMLAEEDSTRRSQWRRLADHHYERSLRWFRQLDESLEVLRVQAYRVALVENTLESGGPERRQLTHYASIFRLMGGCAPVLRKMMDTRSAAASDVVTDSDDDEDRAEQAKLVELLLARLRQNLLSLNKLLVKRGADKKKEKPCWAKELYAKAIKCKEDQPNFLSNLADLVDEAGRRAESLK
jgi:hypothetical protein